MRILPDPISRQSNKAIVQKREFWLPVGFFLTQEEHFQQKPACSSAPSGGIVPRCLLLLMRYCAAPIGAAAITARLPICARASSKLTLTASAPAARKF